jgi:hypothetical protein
MPWRRCRTRTSRTEANALLEDAYKRGMLTEPRELRALYIGYMNASRWDDTQKVIDAGVARASCSRARTWPAIT